MNLDRLCIHTITTKPWDLATAARMYASRGLKHITVWRDALPKTPHGPAEARKLLSDHGLSVTSLCRGGFFVSPDSDKRQASLDDNRRMIDEAAALGAPLIVLVCGADPAVNLSEARRQIAAGIGLLLPQALSAGVTLAIEPLHPMYADTRSAINTMSQALDVIDLLGRPSNLGIALDVYHTWWDDRLEADTLRAGKQKALSAFHVCDWRSPTRDMLNDRALMGSGCIPIKQIRSWVEAAGFAGPIEVEIFSNEYWALSQEAFLDQIISAYKTSV